MLSKVDVLYPSKLCCLLIFVYKDSKYVIFTSTKEVMFSRGLVCLSVCEQDNSKPFGQILIKFQDMSEMVKGRID